MATGSSTKVAAEPQMPAAQAANRGAFVALLVVLWAAVLLWISALNLNYEFTPSPGTAAPQQWPRESHLARGGGPTLLVFLHPCCPCSRATLSELERVLQYLPASGRAYCLVSPIGVDKDFPHTSLVESARKMPRLEVVIDEQCAESSRFGAQVSGGVVLYDGAGELRFTGGVTPGRGHLGDNLGTPALVALLSGQRTTTTTTPVFGCPLPLSEASRKRLQVPN
jgi:hypothetical protein